MYRFITCARCGLSAKKIERSEFPNFCGKCSQWANLKKHRALKKRPLREIQCARCQKITKRRQESKYPDLCEKCSVWDRNKSRYSDPPMFEIKCAKCGRKAKKYPWGKFLEVCWNCSSGVSRRHWEQSHPEEARIRRKENYALNRDKILASVDPIENRARARAWQMANPERVRAGERARRALNPEHYLKISRAWRAANREKQNATCRAWRARHPEKAKEVVLRYHLKNPEIAVVCSSRRRFRIKQSPIHFTVDEWRSVKKRQKGKCIDCGKKAKLTVGHLIPVSRGGSNGIMNIAGQCFPCNARQHAKIHPNATLSLFDKLAA
jgi:hypothetical protein